MTDFAARRIMMVDTQVRPNDVTKFPIIEAMLAIPREQFVPASAREAAYVGGNIDLGLGRVMLEPRTLSKLLDALDVQPTDHVLVVGAGLGYSEVGIGFTLHFKPESKTISLAKSYQEIEPRLE